MEGGLGFLGAGYAVAFVILFAYVISLARRQKRLEERMESIQPSPEDD